MAKDYIKVLHIDLANDKEVDRLAKALSNKTRRDILRLLVSGPRTINNIAFELDTPLSTISEHISLLLKSGIISVVQHANERGLSKIISRQFEEINLVITPLNNQTENKILTKEIPIGSFVDFQVSEYCGILDENGYIGPRDNSATFYSPDRFKAGLIWFSYGYLKYSLPLTNEETANVQSISLSFEICSEAPGYNKNWKSDIDFFINDVYVGTYVSPGDFGSRHGKITPSWWGKGGTQYGLLKTIFIDETGTYLDEVKISDVNLANLHLNESNIFYFKIAVDENAKHRGGLNIFLKKFGDYEQDIVLVITYK